MAVKYMTHTVNNDNDYKYDIYEREDNTGWWLPLLLIPLFLLLGWGVLTAYNNTRQGSAGPNSTVNQGQAGVGGAPNATSPTTTTSPSIDDISGNTGPRRLQFRDQTELGVGGGPNNDNEVESLPNRPPATGLGGNK